MEHEIEECLAYHLLRNSSDILGSLTTDHLESFLFGATYRAVLTTEQFPRWRIDGVLSSPDFFADSFKLDTRLNGWRRAIDMSCFSPDAVLAQLGQRADRWHIEFGVDKNEPVHLFYYSGLPLRDRQAEFWPSFLQRPSMHFQSVTGWGLYCFLIGMTLGGDWLALPEMARATELLNRLSGKSSREYGNEFAAFRLHRTPWGVLEWATESEAKIEHAE
jgi:hypothetical protein